METEIKGDASAPRWPTSGANPGKSGEKNNFFIFDKMPMEGASEHCPRFWKRAAFSAAQQEV
jgi:hypothetical protein